MQRKIGIREAKAKLSHYVDLARRGEDVILTERGTPVVRLVAIPQDRPTETDVVRGLARLGLVEPAAESPRVHRPIRPRGNASISRIVREMRR